MSKFLNMALKDIDYQWRRGRRNLCLVKIASASTGVNVRQEKYR